jgi:P27 family predicted phage terminase small subunit
MNPNEPKPALAIPDAPVHLSDKAAEVWPIFAANILGMKVLSEVDWSGLEQLCECYAQLRAAREAVKAYGSLTYTTQSENGTMYRPYPEVAIIADCDRRLAMWLAKFGLTPADRSKVSAHTENGDESPWDSLSRTSSTSVRQ